MKTMALRPVFDKTFVATPAWQDARREKYVEASSMVDDVFRSYRNHDTVDPEGSEQTARGGIGDPLAELARLTGQPYGDGGRDGGQIGRRTTPVPSSVSRARSIVLPSSVPNHPLWRDPNHPLWRDSAGSRRSSRPPDIFPAPQSNSNGVAEDASDHPAAIRKIQYSRAGQPASPGRDDQQPVLPSARTPTFLPTVPDGRHAGEMRATETDETLRAYSFYDARPSPRWRLVNSSARCRTSGAYGSICATAGTSDTGIAFLGAEEGPHDHHPLGPVGANRYLGRGCHPQRDEPQGTRDAMMAYLLAEIPALDSAVAIDSRSDSQLVTKLFFYSKLAWFGRCVSPQGLR
jgi:hypothetical protein